MASFSDYLKQTGGAPVAFTPSSAGSSSGTKLDLSSLTSGTGGAKKTVTASPHKEGPVGWIMDMLSRPEYAVTNAIDSGIHGVHDIATGQGRKGIGELANTLGPAELQGAFSTNPQNHKSGSQLINDTIKTFNPKFDPAKENLAEKIGTGVGGFAADIGLDPLTYLPGPDLFTVGKKVVTGGIDAVKAIKGGMKATDALKSAAKDVGKVALTEAKKGPGYKGKTETPNSDEALAAIAAKTSAADELAKVADPNAGSTPLVEHAVLPSASASVEKVAKASAASGAAEVKPVLRAEGSLVDSTGKQASIPRPATAADAQALKTAKLAKAVKSKPGQDVLSALKVLGGDPESARMFTKAASEVRPEDKLDFPAWRTEAYKLATADPKVEAKMSKLVHTAYSNGKEYRQKVMDLLRPAGAGAPIDDQTQVLRDAMAQHYYENTYSKAFDRNAAQGSLVDALGRSVGAADPVAQLASSTVSDRLNYAKAALAARTSAFKTALGPGLSASILSHKSPAALDDTVTRLTDLLEGRASWDAMLARPRVGADVPADSVMRSVSTNLKSKFKLPDGTYSNSGGAVGALLDRLGLSKEDIPGYGIPYHRMQPSVASIADVAQATEQDVAKEFAGESGTPVKTFNLVQSWANSTIKRMADTGIFTPRESWEHVDEMRKIAKTDEGYGDGYAVRFGELNQYDAYTAASNIMKKIGSLLDKNRDALGRNFYGGRRHDTVLDYFQKTLRTVENVTDRLGVPQTIDVGAQRKLMYLSQIVDTLVDDNHENAQILLANNKTQIPWTNLMDAVSATLHDYTEDTFKLPAFDKNGHRVAGAWDEYDNMQDAVHDALANESTRWERTDGNASKMTNYLVHPGTRVVQTSAGRRDVSQLDLLGMAQSAILRNADKFKQIEAQNIADWGLRGKEALNSMASKEIDDLREQFANANGRGIAALVASILHTPEDINVDAKAIGAPRVATDGVTQVIKDGIGDSTVADIIDLDKLSRATDENVKKMIGQRRFQRVADDEDQFTQMHEGGETFEFGEEPNWYINGGVTTKLASSMNRAFKIPLMHEALRETESVHHALLGSFAGQLNDIQRAARGVDGQELIRQAFTNIQRGIDYADAGVTPEVREIQQQLQDPLGVLYGDAHVAKRPTIDNKFTSEALNIEHANNLIRMYTGREDWMLDQEAAKADVKKGLFPDVQTALANQWHNHDVSDPLAYMNSMMSSVTTGIEHQTLMNDFHRIAELHGMVSSVPKAGWKRATVAAGKKTVLGLYARDDVYYAPEAYQEMQRIDNLLTQTWDHSTPFWQFVDHQWRPVQDLWKYGMTLPNPSHHMRNLTGDSVLTYLANGTKNFINSHRMALKALANTRGTYDGFDAIAALRGDRTVLDPNKDLAAGSEKLFDSRFGPMTTGQLVHGARDRGLLPDFRQLEQLDDPESAVSGTERVANKIKGSKAARMTGSVSEARDHFSRMAHFIQFIQNNQGKYSNIDRLFDDAAAATRKWHPDGSDMTKSEQILRLIIPFYAWSRKAIPLIVESMLTHPNRVTAFNKASFNLAVAGGVNPNSLSDPFPDDQMFPSYLTDQGFGPQFKINDKYYAISPGVATWDVLDSTIAGNPLRNVLGQTSPLLQDPVELATGTNIQTGGAINDWSDWVDSQIPGLSQAARVTGVSPSGTIAQTLTGNPGLQQEYQVAKGNKTSTLPSAISWLTGAGIIPMSQKNQINYAEIEKRNAAGNGQVINP